MDQGITGLRQKRSIYTWRQSQPDSLGMARFRITTVGCTDITYAGNGPEVRIGASGVAVNAFAPLSCTAYFFDGYFWHCCELCQGDPSPVKRAKLESFFDTTAGDICR